MKNPYETMSEKELKPILEDYLSSKDSGCRVESFVPYAKEIQENLSGVSNIFPLRECLYMAEADFMKVITKRYLEKLTAEGGE